MSTNYYTIAVGEMYKLQSCCSERDSPFPYKVCHDAEFVQRWLSVEKDDITVNEVALHCVSILLLKQWKELLYMTLIS